MEEKKQTHPRKKGLLICLGVIVVLLVACGSFLFYQYQSPKFLKRSSINGRDVSGLTTAQAIETVREQYDNAVITVFEGETREQSGNLEAYGYHLDETGLKELVEKAMSIQKNDFFSTFKAVLMGTRFEMNIPVSFDEERFSTVARASRLKDARVPSTDASLQYDENAQQFIIVPETYGNELSDEEWQAYLKKSIDEFADQGEPGGALKITIPEELYLKPTLTADSSVLTNEKNLYNQYCNAKVVYTLGDQTETLDWSTIKDWITVNEDGTGYLREDAIKEWLKEFANRYDTRYFDRTFQTSVGTTVTFPANMNEYGYTTNESAEYEQLLTDLASNTTVTRDPIYYTTNNFDNPVFYSRNGRDDLNGTYVEVNLSMQHLWFYKNGSLIVDSPLVSGCVAKGHETQTGVFPLAYKESPSVLVGSNAADGYETKVQFWMPFYEGQGLHDATWRSSFGGDIYINSGSHGCVNLPYSTAEAIYNNIDAGTAILIYK